MKIRYAEATGCPAGQFVVEAENDVERAILKNFCSFPDYAKDKWEFHIHGKSYGYSGQNSFNFGYWIRNDKK